MFDVQVRLAVCKVSCGDESGTGFLVADDMVMTVYHCVRDATAGEKLITLSFFGREPANVELPATIVGFDIELDICLLRIDDEVHGTPLQLTTAMPREGESWLSFGFPGAKGRTHRTEGRIELTSDRPQARVDIDLSVSEMSKLSSYRGMSGAPLVVGPYVAGMLRLRMDESLGAISTKELRVFLERNGVTFEVAAEIPNDPVSLAERSTFQLEFESFLAKSGGKFVLLDGPHGIGKTTFCRHFTPMNETIQPIGTYCVRDESHQVTSVSSRPESLFDWLSTTVSDLVFGRASRQETLKFNEMAARVSEMLDEASEYCRSRGRIGVVFVDGVNEVYLAGNQLFDFLGLFPATLPKHIVVVFSAPNFPVLAHAFDGRVDSSDLVTIPPLSEEEARHYAYSRLNINNEAMIPEVATEIVRRANGHPLYLTYQIRFANSHPDDPAPDDFPMLDREIEEYYDRIWNGLKSDADAVNLLAIVSRLRSGLPASELPLALNPGEQAVYSSTLHRLQHLFEDPKSTEIFHDSFRSFVLAKTEVVHDTIGQRLGAFCLNNDIPYCELNRIHHLVESNRDDQTKAIEACNQEWADRCVRLEIDPDVLLNDTRRALELALTQGAPVESVRLLLLVQRLSFRYDTLFAQSAGLVASSLIRLGRPLAALRHVVRNGHLIVGVDEALHVCHRLIAAGFLDEAVELLWMLHDKCLALYSTTLSGADFIHLTNLHTLTLLFLRITGRRQLNIVVELQNRNLTAFGDSFPDADSESLRAIERQVRGVPNQYFFTFTGSYSSIKDIEDLSGRSIPSDESLQMRIEILLQHLDRVDQFGLSKRHREFDRLFADIQETLPANELNCPNVEFLVDALIRNGASEDLVLQITTANELSSPIDTQIREPNGVDANNRTAHRNGMFWRIHAYADDEVGLRPLLLPDQFTWEETIGKLFDALAILDGKARRAVAANDNVRLQEYLEYLTDRFLPVLEFSFADRIEWDRSYAIPETTLPFLLECLVETILDCFPDYLDSFIGWLISRSADQLGLYSEGFRECVYRVTMYVSREELPGNTTPLLFELLQVLKHHLAAGVENRHELVPELLRLIEAFCAIGASEEASSVHDLLLLRSMGPSWYKEDQFRFLTTALTVIPPELDVSAISASIAGVLERASGEMTFRRFVRQDKARFVESMSSRGMIYSAIEFFKLQSCGPPSLLFEQLEGTSVDRASPAQGNRYPGGALEEQDTIVRFATTSRVTWELRWALLEVFQFGDERHVNSYAAAYADLINQSGDSQETTIMLERTTALVSSDVPPEYQGQFVRTLLKSVEGAKREIFADQFAGYMDDDVEVDAEPGETIDEQQGETLKSEFHLPGFIGEPGSLEQADKLLEEARHELRLNNVNAAQTKVLDRLKFVQRSGWSLWDWEDQGTKISKAVLRQNSSTAGELVRHYTDIFLSETHAPAWALAESLIVECDKLLTPDEALGIFDEVLAHILLMVGNCDDEIDGFETMSGAPVLDSNEEVFRFLEWLVNHPKWLRREKAADMLLWLAKTFEGYVELVAKTASRTGHEYEIDLAFCILDVFSFDDPIVTWSIVEGHLEIENVTSEGHAFRICALREIAKRAAEAGSASAAQCQDLLEQYFRTGDVVLALDGAPNIPNWAKCMENEWNVLLSEELASASLLNDVEQALSDNCAPYGVNAMFELERSVTTSHFEPQKRPLTRWGSRVRYALNRSLMAYIELCHVPLVMKTMRLANPMWPSVRRTNRAIDSSEFRAAVANSEFQAIVSQRDEYVLHHVEALRIGDDGPSTMQFVEIVAVVVSNDLKRRGFFAPEITSTFSSLERPDNKGLDHETCSSVSPRFTFWGSFTPGSPLPAFLEVVGARMEDCSHYSWLEDRSFEFEYFGRPDSEGSSLCISKDAVSLLSDRKLAWLIIVDNEIVTMIDEDNNELF